MTVVPVCPIHGKAMAESKFGGWYCKSKNADNSFCKEKVGKPQGLAEVAPPVQQGQPFEVGPPPRPPSQASADVASLSLAEAALNFAGRVYAGTGASAEALSLADAAYTSFLKVIR